MNINEEIKKLLTVEQQINSLDDSVNYINNRLSSYYNTEAEKNDIKRNVDHIRTLLLKDYIVSNLSPEQISNYRDSIHKGESVF